MKKKVVSLMLCTALTAAMVSGCGGGDNASSSEGNTPATDDAGASNEATDSTDAEQPAASGGNVIKVGVFEPQTGENGGGGLQEVYGIRYANQERPTVTVGGTEYTIQLVEADNKSDKTEAVTAAQSLISEGVVGVLGSYENRVEIGRAHV